MSGSGVAGARKLRASSIDDGPDANATADMVARQSSKNTVRVCTYYFKGDTVCLRRCIKEFGWVEEVEEAAVGRSVYVWFGNFVSQYRKSGDIGALVTSRHQRSSRFGGMRVACFKEFLQVHLEKLRELYPDELPFQPQGWVLPDERAAFDKYLRKAARDAAAAEAKGEIAGPRPTFIVKPSETSQGAGIFLVQNPSHMENSVMARKGSFVVQVRARPFAAHAVARARERGLYLLCDACEVPVVHSSQCCAQV